MKPRRMLSPWIAGVILLALLASGSRTASAAPASDVTTDQATIDFPNTVTFRLQVTSAAKIASVVLEYGDAEQTCGQVIARAFPQITPGTSVSADWTWDMRQSGSLPPGAQIWWRWRITDNTGQETVTDQKSITWLDSVHAWQTLTRGDIRLHWYNESQNFGQQLLDAAVSGMSRVEQQAGLSNDQPIDLYVYANYDDMHAAVLYEESWTGGQAFPGQNIVIIGIERSLLDWGKSAEVHELTHVLVGHLTFTCLGSVPTWLNEGLAMYSQGALDAQFQMPLDQAIRQDTLISVQSLTGPFPADANQANLAYGESDSLVTFLLSTYGKSKMTALLLALRDGNTPDQALTSVYGFNSQGLENAWRKSVGAPTAPISANPTAIPTPTFVPTIVPVSGVLPAITPTAFTIPPTPTPAKFVPTMPPLSLTLILVFTCCAMGLVVGVLVLAFVLAAQNRKGGKNEKGS